MEQFLEIDHSVLAVNDLIMAERFYVDVMGEIVGHATLDDRSGLTTDEIIRGKRMRENSPRPPAPRALDARPPGTTSGSPRPRTRVSAAACARHNR